MIIYGDLTNYGQGKGSNLFSRKMLKTEQHKNIFPLINHTITTNTWLFKTYRAYKK
jgi:hypothetical protein